MDEVVVRGAERVDEGEIEGKIATAASPRFLGLFRGVVYDYELFDRLVLQRDLARVERLYRRRGYYDAHARAGRVVRTGDRHVRVEIVVDEGEPVLVHSVRVEGLSSLPPAVRLAALASVRGKLVSGEPFDEDAFEQAAADVQRALTDRGWAFAKVGRDAAVDIVHRTADVVFAVAPDRPAVFGPITIEGLGDVPEGPVRRALDLERGERYSSALLQSAQRAVLELSVFASVQVLPDLPDPPPPSRVVPVHVRVERSKPAALRVGGGFELDAFKTALHVFVGWEHRNFLGGLRYLSVALQPGVVLYPLRVDNWVAPERALPEIRFKNSLRQPGLLEARTNGFLRPELNVFPVILPGAIEGPDGTVLGYVELRGSAGVDRTFGNVFGSLSHNVQIENPFAYRGELDPALRSLLLSYPELVVSLDLRDDPVRPHQGVFLGNSVQIAGGPFGGHAADLKLHPDVRGYLPLAKGVTLALRGSVGFLFPFDYGEVLRRGLAQPKTGEGRAVGTTRDLQIIYFRGFFGGGPNSNRGYPARSISPHDVVPFWTPEVAAAQIARACGLTATAAEASRCAIPVGGFTLWETSAELRFAIAGPVSGATFCDAGDVSPQTADVRLTHPHLSCGLGIRYDTPVGPIRLDVGYRIPGAQIFGGPDPTQPEPRPLFGILPATIALGIGEAF